MFDEEQLAWLGGRDYELAAERRDATESDEDTGGEAAGGAGETTQTERREALRRELLGDLYYRDGAT